MPNSSPPCTSMYYSSCVTAEEGSEGEASARETGKHQQQVSPRPLFPFTGSLTSRNPPNRETPIMPQIPVSTQAGRARPRLRGNSGANAPEERPHRQAENPPGELTNCFAELGADQHCK